MYFWGSCKHSWGTCFLGSDGVLNSILYEIPPGHWCMSCFCGEQLKDTIWEKNLTRTLIKKKCIRALHEGWKGWTRWELALKKASFIRDLWLHGFWLTDPPTVVGTQAFPWYLTEEEDCRQMLLFLHFVSPTPRWSHTVFQANKMTSFPHLLMRS